MLLPTGMVMLLPLLKLMTKGLPVTGLFTLALYTRLPPSVIEAALTLSVAVVVLMVSVTLVVAGVGLMVKASKPPPLDDTMVAVTVPASIYTSSAGAATVTLPALAPTGIVITAPLDNVKVAALVAGPLRLAV